MDLKFMRECLVHSRNTRDLWWTGHQHKLRIVIDVDHIRWNRKMYADRLIYR